MAQATNRMRGIGTATACVWNGNCTVYRQLETATPSCVFYYYLVLSLLMLLILVVYVILAKRHKLRERETHQHPGHIVEEHYERYFDQEEAYMRDIAIVSKQN